MGWLVDLVLFNFSKAKQGVGSKLQSCQITLISKRMKNSLVFDMKLFKWGKTNLSLDYHEKLRKNNCAQSAIWPNSVKCSHPPDSATPKHQHPSIHTSCSFLLLLLHFLSLEGDSVAIVVWFEGPLGGKTQVLGLLVCQLGQLHSQFIQMGSCHLLIQLLFREREKKKNTRERE